MTTEQRLERLERENRWMRRVGAVAAAVAAAVFLVGQGEEKPRRHRWAGAAATLGHLPTTPDGQRKLIDKLVKVMLDPKVSPSSRQPLEAKQQLAAIGKAAFPVVLGAMAKIRDTIADNGSEEERRIELGLQRADECLREMDGFQNVKGTPTIQAGHPSTDRDWIAYIVKRHYYRWTRKLQHAATMPGPYPPRQDWSFEELKTADLANARNLVGLLNIVFEGKIPMEEGGVDVCALVRKGELREQDLPMLQSLRFDSGPSKLQIEGGDYRKFPYKRFKGVVDRNKVVPLFWDRKPDMKNGRVVAFNNGTVKYHTEAEVRELLKRHGQLPQSPPK